MLIKHENIFFFFSCTYEYKIGFVIMYVNISFRGGVLRDFWASGRCLAPESITTPPTRSCDGNSNRRTKVCLTFAARRVVQARPWNWRGVWCEGVELRMPWVQGYGVGLSFQVWCGKVATGCSVGVKCGRVCGMVCVYVGGGGVIDDWPGMLPSEIKCFDSLFPFSTTINLLTYLHVRPKPVELNQI